MTTDATSFGPQGGAGAEVDPDARLVQERVERLVSEFPPGATDATEFWSAQYDLGVAMVHFPEGRGGLGVSKRHQSIVNAALREVDAPHVFATNPIGWGMGAPTVLTYGSEDQKDRYLRRIFNAEDIWCQLFSEPGAGSDVAGLATTAVLDGDEWVVNGQKVWTTLAQVSNFGMLLARTDPDQPKHKGLTYFVVDMHAPGVEVRPLRQITGDAEFNEVYFDDVRIPDGERLGERGEGWKVAITTLMNERVALGGGASSRNLWVNRMLDLWRASEDRGPVARDRMARLWIEAEAMRFTNLRVRGLAKSGNPGPEGSVGKLFQAELNQRIHNFCMTLLGADALLYPDDWAAPNASAPSPQQSFLRSQANTIEGGTSNIMRNILGERVLGLPGEPRADKGPWKDIPRS
ncbi:MAG: acyl-CoA dehydrogenase family protein [Acidimicrobiia bacterium]